MMLSVMVVACATRAPDRDHAGVAEVQIDTRALSASGVTRVTVDAAGQTQDLSFSAATGTFDGALVLPPGTQSLVATAFVDDMLVGRSNPTPVIIQTGAVTRVVLRILDTTAPPGQTFGPIFESISYPTTIQAGESATFAISVIAPTGDPVTYAWSSDCADAAFSAPDAATTQFTRPTPGGCEIQVAATSNGFTIHQSFAIAVFAAGADGGAAQISTAFVTAPVILLSLPDLGCTQSTDGVIGSDSSCQTTLASPTTTRYLASVLSWGNSSPGSLEVTDSCGGGVGVSVHSAGLSEQDGDWLPPVAGGTCFLTGRAVNSDGLASTVSIAVLARPGTPPAVPPPPTLNAFLEDGFSCDLRPPPSVRHCGPVPVGSSLGLAYTPVLNGGHPGRLTITDDCAGPQSVTRFQDRGEEVVEWTVPPVSGQTCTVTMDATTLEGSRSEVAVTYSVL